MRGKASAHSLNSIMKPESSADREMVGKERILHDSLEVRKETKVLPSSGEPVVSMPQSMKDYQQTVNGIVPDNLTKQHTSPPRSLGRHAYCIPACGWQCDLKSVCSTRLGQAPHPREEREVQEGRACLKACRLPQVPATMSNLLLLADIWVIHDTGRNACRGSRWQQLGQYTKTVRKSNTRHCLLTIT